MNILLINPNTSVSVTNSLAEAARAVAAPATVITSMTAERGFAYIATRAEAAVGASVTLEMIARAPADVDAIIIGAFGDPGLGGAREMLDVPVVGLSEAGMLTACMLGRRFAVVSFARQLAPWYQECVEWHGLTSRCSGIRTLDGSFTSISDVQNEKADLLVQLAIDAVEEDGADVVVLAGAPLAGLATHIADRIPVPLVDCVSAAVKQAEALHALKPRKATKGTFSRPAPKAAVGLAPDLVKLFSGPVRPRK
ncbi:MAG: aspartate/glutamate racemase family protein [Parvibaculaceae bacterium]